MAGRTPVLLAGLLLCAGAVGATGRTQDKAAPPPPGAMVEAVRQTPMGPVCWAAIAEAISQIGVRCFDGQHPVLMAELDSANDALGRMFLERGWTEQQLEAFRRQMGEADEPTEQLCANKDAIAMYREFASARQEDLAKVTAEMLARPGPPEWGSCL